MPFINYLKYLRIKKGLTQKKLAALIDRAPATVKAYEKTLPVPEDIALKLKEIFELDSTEKVQGYIKRLHVHKAEYKKLLPNLPTPQFSSKPSTIFELLNCHRRTISLRDCHAILAKRGA